MNMCCTPNHNSSPNLPTNQGIWKLSEERKRSSCQEYKFVVFITYNILIGMRPSYSVEKMNNIDIFAEFWQFWYSTFGQTFIQVQYVFYILFLTEYYASFILTTQIHVCVSPYSFCMLSLNSWDSPGNINVISTQLNKV